MTATEFRIALGHLTDCSMLYCYGERAISKKEVAEIEGYVKTCYLFLRGMEDEREKIFTDVCDQDRTEPSEANQAQGAQQELRL